MADDNFLYKVIFIQCEQRYEIYAKYISEESLMGFIEVEELVFNESSSAIVLDTSEEKLRNEFKGVQRFYIPMHNVIRIDEVVRQGVAKVIDLKDKSSTVTPLNKPVTINKTGADE